MGGKTYTTKEIAETYGVTVQTVNRWIKQACTADGGMTVSAIGSQDSTDKRLRVFTEAELTWLKQYIPRTQQPRMVVNNGAEFSGDQPIDGEFEQEEIESSGIFDGSKITALDVRLVERSPDELLAQGREFDTRRGQYLQVFERFAEGFVSNVMSEVLAETEHAIRGAAVNVVGKAVNKTAEKFIPPPTPNTGNGNGSRKQGTGGQG